MLQESYKEVIAKLEEVGDDVELMRNYKDTFSRNYIFTSIRQKSTSGIQELAQMEDNFDDEVITMTGGVLREIMKKTAHFGVNNYVKLESDCHDKWNYHNSFFFAGTLATTIGYGNNAPGTKLGKMLCLMPGI